MEKIIINFMSNNEKGYSLKSNDSSKILSTKKYSEVESLELMKNRIVKLNIKSSLQDISENEKANENISFIENNEGEEFKVEYYKDNGKHINFEFDIENNNLKLIKDFDLNLIEDFKARTIAVLDSISINTALNYKLLETDNHELEERVSYVYIDM